MRYLFILILIISNLEALKVNITKDLPRVNIDVNGEIVEIKRVQDTNYKLKNSYTRTSRPTPPFYIQAFEPIKGVETYGELEVLNFMQNKISQDEGMLIDARMQKWHKVGYIPTSVNIPFTMFLELSTSPIIKKVLDLLDVDTDGKYDFSDAKDLVIYDNGPWDQQAVVLMKNLIRLGYPKSKIYYYRGGMQFWQILGLTLINPSKKGSK